MHQLQSRVLPKLVLDTISCLWLAHDHLYEDMRHETKRAIVYVRQAAVTDTDGITSLLREVADHLVELQTHLESLDRPFTARKVRSVLHRIQHVTCAQNSVQRTEETAMDVTVTKPSSTVFQRSCDFDQVRYA